MTIITKETNTEWIYIKRNKYPIDFVEKLLEENDIHYKTVVNIEIEEIDEPTTQEELELFKRIDSGEISGGSISSEGKITTLSI